MLYNLEYQSPNYSNRTQPVEYVILHYTEMKKKPALDRLTDPEAKVSAHFFIDRDGVIYNLVSTEHVAWHAGESCWRGQKALNENSIGIELDNLGNEEFSFEQISSCIDLCRFLQGEFNIETTNFLGHSDIAPQRKIDPGIYFNWRALARRGFGIWYEEEILKSKSRTVAEYGSSDEIVAEIQQKLAKIGYQIEQTKIFDQQMNYVVRAFQARFYPDIIRKKGSKFYNSDKSHYLWDQNSQIILDDLCKKIT